MVLISSHRKYSGRPGYKDDGSQECVVDKGSIPRGNYTIGKPFHHNKTGSWTMRLTASASNNMCGRDGFMIHGDSLSHPGKASDGCIILDLKYRKKISASNKTSLQVL